MFDNVLEPTEQTKLKEFNTTHRECHAKIPMCAGFTYGFSIKLTPTNLGMRVDAECTMCHKSEDITDYDTW